MATTARSTDYPTGPENGMELIGGRMVFTGPQGYRVRANTDDGTFTVVSYHGSSSRPVWDGVRISEHAAHCMAARLSGLPVNLPTGV